MVFRTAGKEFYAILRQPEPSKVNKAGKKRGQQPM